MSLPNSGRVDMYNYLSDNRLRAMRPRGNRSSAFSLVELIVAVGLLVLMLAMAGRVFSLTTESTGQATALTQVHHNFRTFEKLIREDMKYVRNGESALMIQANPVNAYWTQSGKEVDDDRDPITGYDHPADPERETFYGDGILDSPRADVLMFFTAAKGRSFSMPETPPQPRQVVYGHAVLGEYVLDDNNDTGYVFEPFADAFPPFPEVSPVPARDWHLARRSVLLMPVPAAPGQRWATTLTENGEEDHWISVLEGTVDVVANMPYTDVVTIPGWVSNNGRVSKPHYLPEVFFGGGNDYRDPPIYSRSMLDVTPPTRRSECLSQYFLPHCASFKVEWALNPHREFVNNRLAYEKEIHWIDHGDLGDPGAPGEVVRPLKSLEDALQTAKDNEETARIKALDQLLNGDLGGDSGFRYSLTERFSDDPQWIFEPDVDEPTNKPRVAIFTASRMGWSDTAGAPTGEVLAGDDLFPGMLRITIDLFDDQNRFEKPLRHVVIVPVGSGE